MVDACIEIDIEADIRDGNGLLHVIGCDEELGGDIWSLRRQMDDFPDWFPIESESIKEWKDDQIIFKISTKIDAFLTEFENQIPDNYKDQIDFKSSIGIKVQTRSGKIACKPPC